MLCARVRSVLRILVVLHCLFSLSPALGAADEACVASFRLFDPNAPTNTFFNRTLHNLLRLRYDIRVQGLQRILDTPDDRPIIFLPNHPALTDPLIMLSVLHGAGLSARPVLKDWIVQNPIFNQVQQHYGGIVIPDVRNNARGADRRAVAEGARRALDNIVAALRRGENVLMYPEARLQIATNSQLGMNGGLERILEAVPNARVVIVRTEGLYGSRLSNGFTGSFPNLGVTIPTLAAGAAVSGVFGMPRHPVTLTFHDNPPDFPRTDRNAINRYLENVYDNPPHQRTVVPLTPWDLW